MQVQRTVSWLEMDSPDRLLASPVPPGLALHRLAAADVARARALHDEIGGPHRWPSLHWSSAEWTAQLSGDAIHWLSIDLDGSPVGVAAMQELPGPEVEITVFGLLPRHRGRGLGGAALTLLVRQAWTARDGDGRPIRRVWLHTSTRDGSPALPNYLRRGFRVVRTEPRMEVLPDR